jgi:hypothetical protein
MREMPAIANLHAILRKNSSQKQRSGTPETSNKNLLLK